jgi:hypothetical protein
MSILSGTDTPTHLQTHIMTSPASHKTSEHCWTSREPVTTNTTYHPELPWTLNLHSVINTTIILSISNHHSSTSILNRSEIKKGKRGQHNRIWKNPVNTCNEKLDQTSNPCQHLQHIVNLPNQKRQHPSSTTYSPGIVSTPAIVPYNLEHHMCHASWTSMRTMVKEHPFQY